MTSATPVPRRYLDILDRHAGREHAETGSVATALAEILAAHADDVRAELRQQADASVLLDLVRQYGDARWSEGTELDGGGSNWEAARGRANALFGRIAALVEQLVAPPRWVLVTDDGLYTGPLGDRKTLVELRTIGAVTEVID